MKLNNLKNKTIGFAASGGLDSCTITRWLTDNGVRVVCFTADLGQPDESDIGDIERRMRVAGAADFVFVSLREQIAHAGLRLIQAQARYEGCYWNTTGVARHVTARGIITELKKRGIEIFSHGATGRGNDQVRFQLVPNMLAPELKVYAPWRDEEFLKCFGGRQQMIEFCEARGIPVKATKNKPYSTDANLLGLTHEAGVLESLESGPLVVTPGMGVHPHDAPSQSEEFTVRFEQGAPVSLNGKKVSVLEALETANQIGGRNGVGIASHLVENRFVGVKSRGIYEAPGMELLGTCYRYLLELVLDKRGRELFDSLGAVISKQIYQGYGFDLASQMAFGGIDPVSEKITGTVRVSLRQGVITYQSVVDVPHSLYSETNASMEAVGEFNHQDSEGFLGVLGVSARTVAAAGQADREVV